MNNVLTPPFRVSYPNVFKAKTNELSGQDEFSLVALFSKGIDLTVLKKAAQEVVVEKWGADQKEWPKNLRSPFRNMDEKATTDEATGKTVYPPGMEEGGVYLNLKSKQKPGIVHADAKTDIIDGSDFYAGCFARATVRPYAYEKGSCGVSFGLQNIQKMKDGDALGSRTKAQDDFAPIEGTQSSSNGDATGLFT